MTLSVNIVRIDVEFPEKPCEGCGKPVNKNAIIHWSIEEHEFGEMVLAFPYHQGCFNRKVQTFNKHGLAVVEFTYEETMQVARALEVEFNKRKQAYERLRNAQRSIKKIQAQSEANIRTGKMLK